jgi:alpha-L-fucosidase
VVLTAKHGDEFAMWPSKYTKRNAMEMGPKRDLAGDLLKAVRAAGLKMGFYHNTTYTFWDARFPGRDWVEYMNNSIKELVDLYQPSVLWGDVTDGPVRDSQGRPLPADYWGSKQVLAYFYNHSGNRDDVVANDRWGTDIDGKLLGDFATPERTRMNRIRTDKWETCDSLDPTSWGYNRNLRESDYMTPNQVVDYLVDVVSKNGNLLINIGPRADGTIPEVMQSCLRAVGEWLKINGDAIYGTRPWDTFRDGDVRFTRKGNVLYAVALEWPEETLRLTSLAGRQITNVEMLGSTEPVKWKQDAGALQIQPPPKRPCRYAYTFRITCKSL